MIPMKKSLCAFLCVLVLLGSVAVVGFAQNNGATHPSGCNCSSCAPSKKPEDFSYVEPTADTTLESKGPIEDIISKVAGDDLVDIGKKHDVNRIMALGEKISAQFRNFFARLAESAARLSDRLRALLKIR